VQCCSLLGCGTSLNFDQQGHPDGLTQANVQQEADYVCVKRSCRQYQTISVMITDCHYIVCRLIMKAVQAGSLGFFVQMDTLQPRWSPRYPSESGRHHVQPLQHGAILILSNLPSLL